ncbi:hypothetical protein DPMN_092273 [Dreissena polymorpha]|uniref:Homeobox domain-containing protein n=1 Tax=Dreissena polymorpha TaxID=45954 RepID=A0A9D4R003_DREPO|nr:hypothetical protein DPMN_092273 [Dreissena polymorpha]
MLAIATRMTLTQVSTWFANARRRMKKDNLSDDEDDLGTSGDGELLKYLYIISYMKLLE